MMLPRYFLLFSLAFIFCIQTANADDNRSEIDFIEHLVSQEFWGDVIYTIDQFEQDNREWLRQRPQFRDVLNFWSGWAGYYREELSFAAGKLNQVSPASSRFNQSRFYHSYLLAHLSVEEHNPALLDSAQNALKALNPEGNLLSELHSFQLGGMSLLNRDFETYDRYSRDFTGNFHAMAGQQQNFEEYSHRLQEVGGKSPAVAGLMSAVIPGSGKIYAGRRGDGISTFLQVAVFGGLFAESAINAGFNHPRTWISGSALGVFYSANIWGSVVSVRITQQEVYEQLDQQILLDLHIPLRTVFQ